MYTPRQAEIQAFDCWAQLTPSDACKASFWGRVTYNHIENDLIESSYLAKNGRNDLSGLARINEALQSGKPDLIDAVARTIIRRFSGFPEARGGFVPYLLTAHSHVSGGASVLSEKLLVSQSRQ